MRQRSSCWLARSLHSLPVAQSEVRRAVDGELSCLGKFNGTSLGTVIKRDTKVLKHDVEVRLHPAESPVPSCGGTTV